MIREEIKMKDLKISKGTIVRTIMLIIVVVNMILQHFGIDIINVNESEVLSFVEIALELAVIVTTFWKNNSFSKKAIQADEFLKTLKESE